MMKKVLSISGVTIIFLLTSCTQEYKLERMYYFANKKYRQILQNPSQANPKQIDATIAEFYEIINTDPNWPGIGQIKCTIAHLYFLKKDYNKAREKFREIISEFPFERGLCLQAEFFIGMSYYQENKWEKALPVFEKIIRDYPLTRTTMDLFHFIAEHYEKHKERHLADKVLRDAIAKYEKIINEYPYDRRVVIIIEDFIISTYEKLNDWEGLMNMLQKMATKYHNTERGAQSLYRLAKSYESRKKIKEAIKFYNQFIKEYPEHKFVSIAKEKISSLELFLPRE